MARHKGITTSLRSSVYRGSAGLSRGIQVDAEIGAWINEGVPPSCMYARRLASYIEDQMQLTDLKAQV